MVSKIIGKIRKRKKISKGEQLIYIVIILWIIFGILAIWQNMNLAQLAGYYASLILFVSTYLWGDFRRESNSTSIFEPGPSSSRELMIYVVLFLWSALGAIGIFFLDELNTLTVYFGALSPFVMSYIIYDTTKGTKDLPIFDGKIEEIVDNSMKAADFKKTNTETKQTIKTQKNDKIVNLTEPLENVQIDTDIDDNCYDDVEL